MSGEPGIFFDAFAREIERIRNSPEFKRYVELAFPKYPNIIPPRQPIYRRWGSAGEP